MESKQKQNGRDNAHPNVRSKINNDGRKKLTYHEIIGRTAE